MLFRHLSVAMVAALLSATAVQAQSLSRLGGPANLPPAGFDGQQFVDARGCLFMRAGFGGNVTWIPRVDRSHNPLCGYPPSFGQAVAAAVEADMAPDPQAAPAQPAAVAAAIEAPAAPNQPRAQGGFWAALFGKPAQPASVAVAAPAPQSQPAPEAQPVRLATIPKPPKGYKLAWTDDRLNPMRGIGTAQGQAQQDQVWTRQVPAQLVAAAPRAASKPAGQVSVSTMSAPESAAPALAVQAFVQVGSFADPANAQGAKDRLKALGLPVATAQITRKGKVLTVVYAGPFTAAEAAQAGLAAARSAGFDDAVLRMN